jgi:hypothetical protein
VSRQQLDEGVKPRAAFREPLSHTNAWVNISGNIGHKKIAPLASEILDGSKSLPTVVQGHWNAPSSHQRSTACGNGSEISSGLAQLPKKNAS